MASISLSFRQATPADIDAILPIIRRAYRGREGWTTEADWLNDKRISPAGLLEKINNPRGVVFVAIDDGTGEVVSCCELELQKSSGLPVGYFGLFAVDPSRQAQGIGRRVMEWAEEYAKDRWAVQSMEMWVIYLRDDLIEYYGRRGYRRTGETREFPYEHLYEGKALRDDLYFDVLRKEIPPIPN
ncbi:uncharacterized protein E0L32_010253 [Thyridium curvatum]|uniref:N-acetyltransferase domain-containing protein n=1 Tax=Thyridium curvatum TaxID=1093900 RepID=A0A507AKQ5_9PEZI|nr:uncharacterized protein E0L32_010253 [Thyridium curvatum]TPX08053.1 hypothetical protein E0L32_010253 [Thyridium curvatum]